jgi:O-antigen/teichoic acid export membrane protein
MPTFRKSVARRLGLAPGTDLREFAGDTAHVAAWEAATSIADVAQIALLTHFLGLTEFGQFALVTSVVALVGRFFDVRVGIAATTHGATELPRSPQHGAAVFRFSYLVDATTGLAAVAALVPLSLIVGPGLIGSSGTELILLYTVTLLVSTVDESSLAVLRLFDRYRLVAAYTVPLELLRVALVLAALIIFGSLQAVIGALIIYSSLRAIANGAAAALTFRGRTERSLFASPESELRKNARRLMVRTIMHTNVVMYTKLVQKQLPTILLGAISGPLDAGLYKVGLAGSLLVARLSDPALVAALPRLSRLWATGQYARVGTWILHCSRLSISVMVTVTAAVVLFREPILTVLGGEEAVAGAGVLVASAVALAIDGALFWNASLLFAAGRARTVAWIAGATAATQIGALVPLTLAFGATGAALAFLISVVLANALYTVLALRVLEARVVGQKGVVEGGVASA